MDYGIRPYVEKEGDELTHTERMKRPTWAYQLSVMLEKHSELIRPYSDDINNYAEMEHFYPPPINMPNWPDGPPGTEVDIVPYAGRGWCALTCVAPLYCADPVKCHPNIMFFPPGLSNSEAVGKIKWTAELYNNTKSKWEKVSTQQGDSINPLKIKPPDGTWAVWPTEQMDKLRVGMTDAAGNKCTTELNVFCRQPDCCTNPPAFSWDVANCDGIIDPSTGVDPTATLTIIGGCPPYTWILSGSSWGYTISPNGASDSLSATVTCTAATCNGTGPTGYYPTPRVKVTDACGTILNYDLKNYGGKWSLGTSTGICELAGVGTYYGGGELNPTYYRTQDGNAWRQWQTQNGWGGGPATCDDRNPAQIAACETGDSNCTAGINCVHCIEDYQSCQCYNIGTSWRCHCTQNLHADYWWC